MSLFAWQSNKAIVFSFTPPKKGGVPVVAEQVTNPTSIHEDAGSNLSLAHCIKDLALPGRKHGLDPALLWL